MTFYRADIEIPMRSGIKTDAAHTHFYWNFSAGTATDSDFTNLAADIEHFFGLTATGASFSVASKMASTIQTNANACTVRFYAKPLAKGPWGAPVATKPFTIATVGANAYPSELAVCLSLRSEYGTAVEFGSGVRPRAHHRNRSYIGPLGVDSGVDESLTLSRRVAPLFRGALLAATDQYLNLAALGHGFDLSIHSPSTWDDFAATRADVDDAFDVQRRRGVAPTVRQELVLT